MFKVSFDELLLQRSTNDCTLLIIKSHIKDIADHINKNNDFSLFFYIKMNNMKNRLVEGAVT